MLKKFISLLFILIPVASASMEDQTIYALSNGTYTYKNTNYTLEAFPIDKVLSDKRSQDGPSMDSVVPVTIEIFPVDNVDINTLRTLVRPLAIQFHRREAKVNTRFLNQVIPYLFKKKEFFEVQAQ